MYLLCNIKTQETVKTFKRIVKSYRTEGESFNGVVTKEPVKRVGTLEKISKDYDLTSHLVFCTISKDWYKVVNYRSDSQTHYTLKVL